MNRKSRSLGRRSSILKIDWNKDEETGVIGNKSKRGSRRVSFAETYQVKEFPRDSPRVWKTESDDENDENQPSKSQPAAAPTTITGLDKLLTGAIQTPYQDIVSECALPEVSVDSFNIFDSNRTVLDMVDMEETLGAAASMAGGGAGAMQVPPGMMDFPTEPSGEIKIDQGAFLKTLGGGSDSMRPMQLYSPNRDTRANSSFSSGVRSPLKGLPVQTLTSFNYHDKENILVHSEMLAPYTTGKDEPEQPLYDVKQFFSNLLGPDTAVVDKQKAQPESSVRQVLSEPSVGQDETRIFSGEPGYAAVEETRCIGGILAQGDTSMATAGRELDTTVNLTVAMEETRALGGLMNRTQTANVPVNVPSGNQTMAMDETKVVGGILDKTSMGISCKADKTMNVSIAMEETKPLGGLMERSFSSNFAESCQSDDKTVAMEETRPIGGILDKTSTLNNVKHAKFDESMDLTLPMEDSRLAASAVRTSTSVHSSVTFSSNTTVAMEETHVVGGLLDKTSLETLSQNQTKNQSVTMEETHAGGGILNRSGLSGIENKSQYHSEAMEETGAVGGILDRSTLPAVETHSRYETQAMEETRPVGGGIFNKSIASNAETTQPGNKTMAMDETKSVGGIIVDNVATVSQSRERDCDSQSRERDCDSVAALPTLVNSASTADSCMTNQADYTKNITMAMEETKALGGILKDAQTADQMEVLGSWGEEKTRHVDDAMEETKLVGGLLKDQSGLDSRSSRTLDKTAIEEKTVTFDRFQADWTGSQLLQNKSLTSTDLLKSHGKERNPSSDSKVNSATTVEAMDVNNDLKSTSIFSEQSPSIETSSTKTITNTNSSVRSFNRTVADTQVMEETRCVTGHIQVAEPAHCEDNRFVVDEEITFKKTVLHVTDMDITNCADVSLNKTKETVTDEKMNISRVETVGADQVTKGSNKRLYSSVRESPKPSDDKPQDMNQSQRYSPDVFGGEKTRDMTQSQLQLTKLREMLINSKKKAGEHLRTGDIKTPSKLLHLSSATNSAAASRSGTRELMTGSVGFPAGSTGSPVAKKPRVLSNVLGDASMVAPRVPATAASLGQPTADSHMMDVTQSTTTGIDDEQMPDVMKNEMGTFLSNDTHTHMSLGNDTRSSDHTRSTEDRASSGGIANGTSNTINMSVISNKSFASSFNIPEGPLTLESFYTLTTRPASKISRGRCSTIFAPKVDLEDLEEVLAVLLTLAPTVDAKKETEAAQQQKITMNMETAQWLEKTLEETQPQIFQECAQATADELQEIRDRLKTLIKCCYNEAKTSWKTETGDMVRATLDNIRTDGCKKAECILEDIRTDSASVDKLLASLDTDLEELEKAEAQLSELQIKQDTLSQEHERVCEQVEEKRQGVSKLECEQLAGQQSRDVDRQRAQIRSKVQAQLLCVDWNLDELTDEVAVFTFNEDQLELRVDSVPDTTDRRVKHVSFSARPTSDRLDAQEEMAQRWALQAVDTRALLHQFPSLNTLPQMLKCVSETVREINQFCQEVRAALFRHKVDITDNRITVELWSIKTLDLIKVVFTFDLQSPLYRPASAAVQITLGNLSPEKIESRLTSVKPGQDYLSRLIQAVDFSDLHR